MSEATGVAIDLSISGMTCGNCAPHVKERLAAVPGVDEVDVRYPEGTASVRAATGIDADPLMAALIGSGYSATPLGGGAVAFKNGTGGDEPGGAGKVLAVVGGGSAGFAAAIRAVEKGARVLMVQEGTIGGTCVNVGCVPSKTLIRAGEVRHRQSVHPFEGISTMDAPVDWERVRQGKDDLVNALRKAKYEDVLAAYPEITLIEGRGVLTEDGMLELSDGTPVPADAVVVATGSSAWIPDVPGLQESGYLDSTALLDIQALPESLIVLGAGSVGLELAQAYSRLGVDVTVIARSRLISGGDPDVSDELARYLRSEGIDVHTYTQVTSVVRDDTEIRAHTTSSEGVEATLAASEILVASGRRANTADLGLEGAGVQLGRRGEILVDEHMATGNPRVFAAGDVTGGEMHVYVAAKAGNVAAENALGGAETVDWSVLPQVTFTDPSVASVGLTEAGAKKNGLSPIVSKLPLEHVPRALAARDTRGFIKLVADADTRRIIGAHVLAPEGGELIMEPALAIRFGLTIEDLTSLLHPYLTQSEGIKLAALTFDKDVEKLSCCAV